MLRSLFVVIFFSIRSINPWNDLPNAVVTTNSVNNFKILLDKFYHERFSFVHEQDSQAMAFLFPVLIINNKNNNNTILKKKLTNKYTKN